MADVPGRQRALTWSVSGSEFDVEKLATGTGDFRLTLRDGEILGLLFDRHFLQARHLTYWAGFTALDKFHKRIRRLYEHGLVARAKGRPPFRETAEYIYALTKPGLRVLAAGLLSGDDAELADDAIEALEGGWEPPFLTQGLRIAPFHELAVADFCLALSLHAAANSQPIQTVGSRSLTEHYTLPGRGSRLYSVSPDAAAWIGSAGKELLVEVQRSVTPKKVLGILRKYQDYFRARRSRDAHFKEPLIVISIDDIHNAEQYWRKPYEQTLALAQDEFFRRAIFVPESRWRHGDWTADHIHAGPVNLLDFVLAHE